MTVTPQITADLEEYPELGRIIQNATRRVADLMQMHDITEIRRIRKTGTFERPYAKDVVLPLNIPGVPQTVAVSRFTVGAALLDYLESIGVNGMAIVLNAEETAALAGFWGVKLQPAPAPAAKPEPKPAEAPAAKDGGKPSKPSAKPPAAKPVKAIMSGSCLARKAGQAAKPATEQTNKENTHE